MSSTTRPRPLAPAPLRASEASPDSDDFEPGAKAGARVLAKLLGLDQLLGSARALGAREGGEIYAAALEHFRVQLELREEELRRIPTRGPVVLVANHPTGLLDGLILGALMHRRREDVRIMGNYLLKKIEPLEQRIIAVDPYGTNSEEAWRRNLRGLKDAMSWVRQGGALGVFPSGSVARHLLLSRRAEELPWNEVAVRIARGSGAAIVPIHIDGRNSELYRWLGRFSSKMRTALFPRELWNKRGGLVRARIGESYHLTAEESEDVAATRKLREYVLTLGRDRGATAASAALHARHDRPDPSLRLRELEGLDPERRLAGAGSLEVWLARAAEIPRLMDEIGRQREATFRGVGEGTGRERDLDDFDARYWHLVLVDREQGRVAGGYRLAPAGPGGQDPRSLYVGTLFDITPGFIDKLGPSLELGRSFVHPEWQGERRPLDLLWQGIGAFLMRHPEIRHLYGCVSMSARYSAASRSAVATWMTRHRAHPNLESQVAARFPLDHPRGFESEEITSLTDLKELSRHIAQLEPDGEGLPVLWRHYLRLGAKVLGFSVDPEFQNCVDGLITVDLREVPPRILARYLGGTFAESLQAIRRI
jgi:putative hemolysin